MWLLLNTTVRLAFQLGLFSTRGMSMASRGQPGERITALAGKFSCYRLSGQVNILTGMSLFALPLHPGIIALQHHRPRPDGSMPPRRGLPVRPLHTTRPIRLHHVPQMTTSPTSQKSDPKPAKPTTRHQPAHARPLPAPLPPAKRPSGVSDSSWPR